jgi:hypothetical protein
VLTLLLLADAMCIAYWIYGVTKKKVAAQADIFAERFFAAVEASTASGVDFCLPDPRASLVRREDSRDAMSKFALQVGQALPVVMAYISPPWSRAGAVSSRDLAFSGFKYDANSVGADARAERDSIDFWKLGRT